MRNRFAAGRRGPTCPVAARLAVAFLAAAVLAASASAQSAAAPGASAGAGTVGSAQPYQTGVASWYGEPFHGRPTASGEPFDKAALTAAHPSLPFGTLLLVRNLDNGLEARVRVNDRGPFVGGRIIDLSEAAGRLLGMAATGTARVALFILETPPVPRKVIQLGAYSLEANAQAAGARAGKAGLAVRYERAGAVIRVLVTVPAESLEAALAALAAAGFAGMQVRDEKP